MNKLHVTIIILLAILIAFLSLTVSAQSSPTFTAEGGVGPADAQSPPELPQQFLSQLYRVFLGFVGIAALLAITIGGTIYIFSGAVETTNEAKRWFRNAFWGLIIAAGSFLLLNTINPELVRGFDLGKIVNEIIQSNQQR